MLLAVVVYLLHTYTHTYITKQKKQVLLMVMQILLAVVVYLANETLQDFKAFFSAKALVRMMM